MSPDAASLPDDIALLKAMLIAVGAELEQLRMQVARLRRMAFGRSSEKLTHQADQLELGLEEREAEAATAAVELPPAAPSPAGAAPGALLAAGGRVGIELLSRDGEQERGSTWGRPRP